MTVVTSPDRTQQLEAALGELEFLREAVDAYTAGMLARDNLGWATIGAAAGDTPLDREVLLREARTARVMSVADPLIRRAVSLRTAYVHGQGVTVNAPQEENAEQDLNAVVQAFLDDKSNQASFTSQQAREELERTLATDGNAFHALPTSPLTGRVQVRRLPFAEVVDVIHDPDDNDSPWFYRREYQVKVVEPGSLPSSTRTRRETRKVLYPALGYMPASKPRSLDGVPIEWDKPVIHTRVNRIEGSCWGIPDLLAALPYAQGYGEFLQDWARLVKALSRYAYRISSSTGRRGASIRTALEAAPVAGTGVADVITAGEGQKIEAIGKSGATIDSESGRPLAAMVASATDVPVTMLLGDPGVTGARATAETLDLPVELVTKARQTLHSDLIRRILDHVIDSAVSAPQGPLQGTRRIDSYTQTVVVTLAGDQPRSIEVSWPDVSKVPVDVQVKAIKTADETGKLPPLVIAQLLGMALDVPDLDEMLASLVDDDGNFVYPDDADAARAQQNAVAAGQLPA